MFTVALIGLDGVGKTTVSNHLTRSFPLPLEYVYMGANIEASNYTLPTTRWWWRRQGRSHDRPEPAAAEAAAPRRRAGLGAVKHGLRKGLGFANRIAEEAYRQLVAADLRRRGFIVLQDRHFTLDYYHGDRSAASTPKRRLQARLRRFIHREPDLVICLDAPARVAFARKGEFSEEHLERRRAEYLSLGEVVDHFEVVDANRELPEVIEDVTSLILRFREERAHA